MPITSYMDKAKDLNVFKVTGALSLDKIMPVVKAFYEGDPTRHVLWDLIDTTDIQLTSEEVETVAKFKPRFVGKREAGKTAFVAQKDIAFGLSRMFQIQSDVHQAPITVRVFRSIDDARQWFDEK